MANRATRPRPAAGYDTEVVTASGPEFDKLWKTLAPEFSIVGVRDRGFVRWRFLEDPIFRNTVLVARRAGGALAGYIAFRVSTVQGAKVARVLDVFSPPSSRPVADTLLSAMLTRLEGEDVCAVYCLGLHPKIRGHVKRRLYLAPSRLDQPAWLLWKGPDHLGQRIYDPASWHVSLADSDIGFAP